MSEKTNRKHTLWFPVETWRRLQHLAVDRGVRGGAAQLVREAVDNFLEDQDEADELTIKMAEVEKERERRGLGDCGDELARELSDSFHS